jgi:spore coat polysaccharide biosynthesis protein SpsF
VKFLAIVQARMSSSRLPGKVLQPVADKPLVWHAVRRVRAAGVCQEVLVATSDQASDDALAGFCRGGGIPVFRGSLDDVLDRYYRAAESRAAAAVVRATADCPLLDPELIREVVQVFETGEYDYVSNTIERSYPDGLDTEVFSFAALERAWREATLPSEREHVTPYIWKRPHAFRVGGVRQQADHSAHRWTVDEPADLAFVRAVFRELRRIDFGRREVLELIERKPELLEINQGIRCNEGYERSLREDGSGGQR